MRTVSQLLIALLCGFSFSGIAAQGASPAQDLPLSKRPPAVAPSPDRRVFLDVVVADRSGNPVAGLQQQDFTLIDNKTPQTISYFHAADGTTQAVDPLQVIVIVDAVNTMFQGLSFEREQLDKFLQQDGGKLPVPMSLMVLTDASRNLTPTTRDGRALADSLDAQQSGLRTIGKSQGFYGAVDRIGISLNALEKLASYESIQPGRKLLLWLGPGWPLLSSPSMDTFTAKTQASIFNSIVRLSAELRDARIALYNLNPRGMNDSLGHEFYYEVFLKGVSSAKSVQNGDLALQVLATQSGGSVLNVDNDLLSMLARCLSDTKTYYTLGFDSPEADRANEYHNVQVKVDKPKVNVRTRTGYYAQP